MMSGKFEGRAKPGEIRNPAGKKAGLPDARREFFNIKQKLIDSGMCPFDTLIELMRPDHEPKIRQKSAIELAHYVVPPLKSVELSHNLTADDDLKRFAEQMTNLVAYFKSDY